VVTAIFLTAALGTAVQHLLSTTPAALLTLVSVLVVSTVPLLVARLLPADDAALQRVVRWLVCFAVGALLGAAFLHLVPEALANGDDVRSSAGVLLAGFFVFFLLERYLWTHQHDIGQARGRLPPLAALNLVGDGAHNLIDGMAIAAAYAADRSLGVMTTVAVLLHEVPQEIGDYGVLLQAGLPRRRAMECNLASGLIALVGAAVVLLVRPFVAGMVGFLVPFAAGGFIYIAAADLIPQLKDQAHLVGEGKLLLGIALGIAVTSIPLLFSLG
jgi:zinc and cadmium transporter